MSMDGNDRTKAVELAVSQIERQFGKGSIMKLGDRTGLDVPVISTTALLPSTSLASCEFNCDIAQSEPDITIVTPVFDELTGEVIFYVASRGHHADIGGITPGSMPPAGSRSKARRCH